MNRDFNKIFQMHLQVQSLDFDHEMVRRLRGILQRLPANSTFDRFNLIFAREQRRKRAWVFAYETYKDEVPGENERRKPKWQNRDIAASQRRFDVRPKRCCPILVTVRTAPAATSKCRNEDRSKSGGVRRQRRGPFRKPAHRKCSNVRRGGQWNVRGGSCPHLWTGIMPLSMRMRKEQRTRKYSFLNDIYQNVFLNVQWCFICDNLRFCRTFSDPLYPNIGGKTRICVRLCRQ